MITVKNNNVGTSARKVRQVCDLIRRKKVDEALKILRFCEKKETAIVVTKLINSGLAIATESKKYDLDKLIIEIVKVDEGPSLKRIMPRAQGRAYRISKKSSYITLSLKEA
jgi:large subunit ribosomal protein L22